MSTTTHAQHTPGPWIGSTYIMRRTFGELAQGAIVRLLAVSDGGIATVNVRINADPADDEIHHCDLSDLEPETAPVPLGDLAKLRADAVAAPELLEAAAWAEKELAIHAERDPMCARLGNVLAHVRAAIAKAEGRA